MAVLIVGGTGCTLPGDTREDSTHSTATLAAPGGPSAEAADGGVPAAAPPLTTCEATPTPLRPALQARGTTPPERAGRWKVSLGR